MNYDEALEITGMLAALPYFPAEEMPRAAIANQVLNMCATAEQALWLMNRALALWTKWESARELRALLCSKYKPADGIEVNFTGLTADGVVPAESPEPKRKALPEPRSRIVTADGKLQQAVSEAAERKRLDPPPPTSRDERLAEQRFNKLLEEAFTGQPDREEIKPPRHKRQSEIWQLAKDEEHPAAAPGTYVPVTYEDVRRAVADLRAKNEEEA